MDTRNAHNTANNATPSDASDKNSNGLATMDGTTNFSPSISTGPHEDDHFSENSSSSKRVKLDAGPSIVTKSAIASMIQDQNSPLVEANLRSVLSNRAAFDSLKPDQKERLMAMLPSRNTAIDQFGNRRPSDEFLLSNPDWAQNIGAFQDDLREGRLDPQWLAEALEAHRQRQAGRFDEYKEGEFESFWGQRQKLSSNVIAGMSSDVKLVELFRKDTLKVGDIWSFARTFGKKSNGQQVLVEKEMMVTDIVAGQPTVVFPTGQAKLSHPGRENVVLPNVTGPGQVVAAVLDTDGRVKDPPHGNAWKSIRVLRDNQDLGTLWDIRQAYHFRDREGEYKSAVNGTPYRRHRAAAGQAQQGLLWQPPATLNISPEFRVALNKIALPGTTLFRVDYRVMIKDGLPIPSQPGTEDLGHDRVDNLWVDKMLQVGPAVFPTAFTRSIASEHGQPWSHGHAHLGSEALGAAWSAALGKRGKSKHFNMQQIVDFASGMVPVPITSSQRHNLVCLLNANPSWIPQRNLNQAELSIEVRPAFIRPEATWERLTSIQPHHVDEVSSTALQSTAEAFSGNQPGSFLNYASVPSSRNLLHFSNRGFVNANQRANTANPSQTQQIGFLPSPIAKYDENGNPYYDSYSPNRGWFRTIYPPMC